MQSRVDKLVDKAYDILNSTSEGKKMPKKRATTGGKLQKPLGKKISFSQ